MNITAVGSSTLVNFRTRASATGGFWSEDAMEGSTVNGDGTTSYYYFGGNEFTDTTNVVGLGVTLTVPEPAVLGLSLLIGVCRRSRRRAMAD
jgi:hypothetical protein